MLTVRLAVEYDGTSFFGMQYQPAVRTVAGVMELTLSRLLQEPIKITCAGRTDTGVHASGQVVSFTTSRSTFPFERLALALNSALPADVSVREAAVVASGFSARFDAVERAYVYAILNRSERSALLGRYAYHVWAPIDIERCIEAASHAVGRHDFRSFCGTPPDSGNTVRTVRSLNVRRVGDLVRVDIAADGFVHRMVRTLVGTLVECGTGRRQPAEIPAILAARDRATAGLTAPARGLYLAGVRYRDGYDSFREPQPIAAKR